MLSFKREKWGPFFRDAQSIMPLHWKEMALDQATIPLAVDGQRFQVIDDQDLLHIITARDGERLVGYFVAIVMPHLHYKDSGLMAFTDMYFILQEYRGGGAGVKLFFAVEQTLRERGVKKAYLSCKVHQDHSVLFEAMGWRLTDKSFTKCFG